MMKTKRVKCLSGLTGYQCRLQSNYSSFEEFEGYCENYGNHKTLGFDTPQEAWDVNPIIQGSTEPSDYRVVLGAYNHCPIVNDEVKELFKQFLSDKIKKEYLIAKLKSIDAGLKKLFGSPKEQSFWFRLHKGDTLAFDARKLQSNLELHPSTNNYKHTIECLELGVEIGVETYYS